MTDVTVETCLARDRAREKPVGDDVILGMAQRFLGNAHYPLPLPDEVADEASLDVYVAKAGTPIAVMIDIDGTCALMGTRSPFDETRVHEDAPNRPVLRCVQALIADGFHPIFCSGRTEACREVTARWLETHLPVLEMVEYSLHMRAEGDMRKDAVVKRELFDAHIRDGYDVRFVLDDRDQVVEMWRSLGLPVFQVAPGDF